MGDPKREFVHGLWAAVADRWDEHADYVESRSGAITKAMLDGAAIRPTDRVLELACGPGGLGLAAAAIAAEVVSSDVVPTMVEIAARRAAVAGATNVTTKVLDIEEIAEPDASFDVVIIREGLMFAIDPAGALSEMHRVLRPGGRLAVAVWGSTADNPWLSIVMDGVAAQVGHPVPPPGMPGPFALSDESELERLAGAAGYVDIDVQRVSVPLHAESFDAWWSRTMAVAGPVAGMVAAMSDDAKSELVERLRAGAGPYETRDGIDFPGTSLVLSARVP